jgi:hypothetical protein
MTGFFWLWQQDAALLHMLARRVQAAQEHGQVRQFFSQLTEGQNSLLQDLHGTLQLLHMLARWVQAAQEHGQVLWFL